ncbi:hypothetical protein P7K49_033545 [Saguinus oedipus]|uniref:Uncharacterized protein n=1 Tax=Saguinus oedipus TaxID=9490 RepID=A0ABQ9TT96_SAGOE|nr:hypothetical protein P7K49_033545 [Saguinus oedipus]
MAVAEGAGHGLAIMAASRLELNLVRLLSRCEAMAAEKRDPDEWRLEKGWFLGLEAIRPNSPAPRGSLAAPFPVSPATSTCSFRPCPWDSAPPPTGPDSFTLDPSPYVGPASVRAPPPSASNEQDMGRTPG